ncbi:MAG TPA: GC-type dockerin domain-anchored protein [Phycisphaerales bacterium]|nr:GC-type dockerin domain-anchored protein [Phycisphaerales bacterium]
MAHAQNYRPVRIETPEGLIGPVTPLRVLGTDVVVGTAVDEIGLPHGVLWVGPNADGLDRGSHDLGVITDGQLPVGAGAHSWAGWTTIAAPVGSGVDFIRRAWWWDWQVPYLTIDPLAGGVQNGACGVSDSGIVTGWSEIDATDSTGSRVVVPFTWSASDGSLPITILEGYEHAQGTWVNSAGTVVGEAFSLSSQAVPVENVWGIDAPLAVEASRSAQRAFISFAGEATALDERLVGAAFWSIERATYIAESGEVLGVGYNAGGIPYGLLLIPVNADLNDDDVVEEADFALFMEIMAEGQPGADINGDGVIDVADAVAFVQLWTDGVGVQHATYSSACKIADMLRVAGIGSAHSACMECKEWNRMHRGQYDPNCNPKCYGCHGGDPHNKSVPKGRGAEGFPGSDRNNPDAPSGGPGGDGINGEDGGHGGDGVENGTGGSGGRGGDAPPGSGRSGGNGGNGGRGGGSGGGGGRGGDGGEGSDTGGSGGNGGKGGNGTGRGTGGEGGDGGRGGTPGNGGHGGDGGDAGPSGGDGGAGGDGGDGNGFGHGGFGGDGGDGTLGGRGGDGGEGGNGGPANGGGGRGGRGGDGGPGDSVPGRRDGGSGGRGGEGGDGGRRR